MTLYLSASAIKDYLSCSMRYFCRRYHKSEGVTTPAMLLGSVVHKAIEVEWRDKDRALALAKDLAEKEDLTTDLQASAQMYVRKFFSSFASILKETDTIELDFKIKYAEDVYLIGKIDRIIHEDNVVIDWKTGKRPPSPMAITSDPQFILYNWAYRKLYKKVPLLYHASLYKGKLSRYVRSGKNEFVLFNEIIPTMVEDITKGKYVRSGLLRWNSPCRNCTYKEYCWNELASRNDS